MLQIKRCRSRFNWICSFALFDPQIHFVNWINRRKLILTMIEMHTHTHTFGRSMQCTQILNVAWLEMASKLKHEGPFRANAWKENERMRYTEYS